MSDEDYEDDEYEVDTEYDEDDDMFNTDDYEYDEEDDFAWEVKQQKRLEGLLLHSIQTCHQIRENLYLKR